MSKPNLRKKSSVLTYNDDAIYRAIENQRKISKVGKTKISKLPSRVVKSQKKSRLIEVGGNKIPEFVYASDGRKFFPCLFCCHAFAVKDLQIGHMQQCSFRLQEISESPAFRQISSKVQHVSRPKTTHSRNRKSNNPKKCVIKSQQFNLNPKLIVQKSKNFGLNTAVGNGAIKIVKPQPNKTLFPKIKLEPGIGNQKIPAHNNVQPRIITQKNKFTKNMNFQPRLGGQTNNFVKQSKIIKQRVVNTSCLHCNLVFENTASLSQHKREKHMFPKIYVSEDELKVYDEMYKNSDMSKCTLCSKPVTKIRWSRHLQTHINEKKYFCGDCNRTFGRKDHLKVHLKTHLIDVINPFVISEVYDEAMQMIAN